MPTLDVTTKAMVLEALDDEYKAGASYRLVIKTFGPVRPFINIVEAEDTHARALEALCARYGIPLPPDDWETKVQPPASMLEACRAGVEGEHENIAMYDRFLRETEEPEVRHLFQRLQARSREAHLPSFERCVARDGDIRQGAGSGRGPQQAPPGRSGPKRFRRQGRTL